MAGLILSGSTLYGTTYAGGSFGWGTIFRFDTDASVPSPCSRVSPLPNPLDLSGRTAVANHPQAQLELSEGLLYGTTAYGGRASANGTVFDIHHNGTGFAVLHNFSALLPYPFGLGTNSDGANSSGNLVVLGNKLYWYQAARRRDGLRTFQAHTNAATSASSGTFAE